MLQIVSFIGFIALVSWISYQSTNRENLDSSEGYFLGGRSLTGWVIAGSMLLTNISTEHLIGMNGSAYKNGAIIIAWEVTSAIALVIGALYFLPRYLKMGLTTIPEFLEKRFDGLTRTMMASLLMVSFVFTLLPIVLYTGALNVESIFGLSELLDITKNQSYLISILVIGLIGGIYATYGGLKMVAVSDSINGIGLLIAGLAVPILALMDIGSGNVLEGFWEVFNNAPEKFNVVSDEASVGPGSRDSILPFAVLFTGLIVNQVYFWTMHQSIIQRSLGAKNLKEGQKGLLITGIFKILVPLIVVLPGLIAFYYFGATYFDNQDEIYPVLVKRVLPEWATGIFIAVILGAILSTFNSALNSAATIFSLGIYKKYINHEASDPVVVKSGKIISLALGIGAMIVAPFVAYAPEGLYQLLQQLNGIFFVPMATIVFAGFFMPWVSARVAKIGLIYGLLFYVVLNFLLEVDLHFVHIWGIEFVSNLLLMSILSIWFKPNVGFAITDVNAVDLSPWKPARILGVLLIVITILIYVILGTIS